MDFEELDVEDTDMGQLRLRKRRSPALGGAWVYEVTLHGEFLMSSAINAAEQTLASVPLDRLPKRPLDVVVGGLGLGYTAAAVLDCEHVVSLTVVEILDTVISWHRERLVPLGERLVGDPRCKIVSADFFDWISTRDPASTDAVLLDIDHSPAALLHSRHGRFYSKDGAAHVARILAPSGVFALWSADPPGEEFLAALRGAFATVDTMEITFDVPFLDEQDTNWIVTATAAGNAPRSVQEDRRDDW